MSLALQPAAVLPEGPHGNSLHFVIGQDRLGRWIAVETHGLAGGIFRSCKDAVDYAAVETRGRPDAIALSNERVDFRV